VVRAVAFAITPVRYVGLGPVAMAPLAEAPTNAEAVRIEGKAGRDRSKHVLSLKPMPLVQQRRSTHSEAFSLDATVVA
jgi:hypothetical protein